MGDIGDMWREERERKRRMRETWVECLRCAIAFGGNGTKNPPGKPCRNCGWQEHPETPPSSGSEG